MIHIVSTEMNHMSVSEIGRMNYAVYSALNTLSHWAVPVFIMITGTLLLSPQKALGFKKLKKYIIRISLVLLIFGTFYAALEIIFNNGFSQFYLILPKALFAVVQNQTWDHLWYLYMLLGLYIATPFVRAAVSAISTRALGVTIGVIYAFTFVLPAINHLFGCKISDLYFPFSQYLMYYLIGHYVTLKDNFFVRFRKWFYIASVTGAVLVTAYDSITILTTGTYSQLVRSYNFLMPLFALSLYLLAQHKLENHKLSKIGGSIAKYSFGIYLVHTFFINMIYKMLHITPLSFPIGIGILLLYVAVFVLSWAASFVLKHIPGIKKLV